MPDRKFRQGFIGVPAEAVAGWGGENKQQFFCFFAPQGVEQTGPLYELRIGVLPGGQSGDLGGLPTDLVVLCARCVRSILFLLPNPCFC